MSYIVYTCGCKAYRAPTYNGARKMFLSIINQEPKTGPALLMQEPKTGRTVDQLPEDEHHKYHYWREGEKVGTKIVAVIGQFPFKMTNGREIWDSSVNQQQYIRCLDGSWKPLKNTVMRFYTVDRKSKSDGFDTFILKEKMSIVDVEDGEKSNSTQPPTKKASGGTW